MLRYGLKFDRLRENLRFFIIVFLFVLAVDSLSPMAITYGESVNAYLFITPPMSVASKVGEIFGLSVNVSNVKDLHKLEFTLIFNASLLDVIDVVQGPFFPPPPSSNFEFEEALGCVKVRISLTDSEAGISSDGTVAYLNLKVIQGPEVCTCTLYAQ